MSQAIVRSTNAYNVAKSPSRWSVTVRMGHPKGVPEHELDVAVVDFDPADKRADNILLPDRIEIVEALVTLVKKLALLKRG